MNAILAGLWILLAASAAAAERGLEIYWVDVEGGGATLIVTPARESVLIDTGFPGPRDAHRIQRVATQAAGLTRIDHVIVTHFHVDHFGGLGDLARVMPVGTLHERYLASAPEAERSQPELAAYKTLAVGRRSVVTPGQRLDLKQAPGTLPVSLEILGASLQFVAPRTTTANPACRARTMKDPDLSDNKNSVVSLLSYGPFRFFDGGDLTWAGEADLVCPRDRVGPVDVYQTDHHGADSSNNPVLLRTLAPTLAVVNNGPRKGGEAASLASLRSTRSIRAVYQLHRSLRVGEGNTSASRIANEEQDCSGYFIRLSVDRSGRTYTVWVPPTGHRRSYATRLR